MEFLAHLHPKIVHFPIAFLLVYVLLELIGVISGKDFFSKCAHLFLFLGVLGALAAVLTGNQASDVARAWKKAGASIPLDLIHKHSDYATFTLWYFTGLLVLRTMLVIKKKFKGYLKYVILVLAFIGAMLVYETGELGGKLVYDNGVGTQLKKMEIQK
jgi:uncharacterized membrane protein